MFLIFFYLFNWALFTILHLFLIGRKKQAIFLIFRSAALLSLFLLHGDGIQKSFIHSEIAPYVKEFEALYGKKVQNVSISFTNFFGSSVVGVCQSYSGGWYKNKAIKLDRKYWEESSGVLREILVFHELGHCELNRDHNDDFISHQNGKKEVFMSRSIMNSYIIDESKYFENRTYYIVELFSKINDLDE